MSQPQTFSFESPWHWKALYKDKTEACSEEIMPGSIDRDKLFELQLWYGKNVVFAIEFKPEQRLILFYRTQAEPQTGNKFCVMVAGWQSTLEGKNVKVILELLPNGLILMRNYDPGRLKD